MSWCSHNVGIADNHPGVATVKRDGSLSSWVVNLHALKDQIKCQRKMLLFPPFPSTSGPYLNFLLLSTEFPMLLDPETISGGLLIAPSSANGPFFQPWANFRHFNGPISLWRIIELVNRAVIMGHFYYQRGNECPVTGLDCRVWHNSFSNYTNVANSDIDTVTDKKASSLKFDYKLRKGVCLTTFTDQEKHADSNRISHPDSNQCNSCGLSPTWHGWHIHEIQGVIQIIQGRGVQNVGDGHGCSVSIPLRISKHVGAGAGARDGALTAT